MLCSERMYQFLNLGHSSLIFKYTAFCGTPCTRTSISEEVFPHVARCLIVFRNQSWRRNPLEPQHHRQCPTLEDLLSRGRESNRNTFVVLNVAGSRRNLRSQNATTSCSPIFAEPQQRPSRAASFFFCYAAAWAESLEGPALTETRK